MNAAKLQYSVYEGLVLTCTHLESAVFWDVMPCGLVMSTIISEKCITSTNMITSSTLKVEAASSSLTSVQSYLITQHHIWRPTLVVFKHYNLRIQHPVVTSTTIHI
jgi:hypothetical protein